MHSQYYICDRIITRCRITHASDIDLTVDTRTHSIVSYRLTYCIFDAFRGHPWQLSGFSNYSQLFFAHGDFFFSRVDPWTASPRPLFFFFSFLNLLLLCTPSEGTNQAPIATAVPTYRKGSRTARNRPCTAQHSTLSSTFVSTRGLSSTTQASTENNKGCRESP